jgi:pimeloyl-ACP methyl ester carboxylesterase
MGAPVLAVLARRLRAQGHIVVSFPYRSVRHTLEDSAVRLHAFLRTRVSGRMHFVAHSLGGLLVLRMLAQYPDVPVGRVVLLGTPCSGCAAAERLSHSRHGRALLGAALPGWKPEYAHEPMRRCEVAAIAGTRRMGMGMLLVRLDGENDGVVRVEETRMQGLREHLVLPVTHSGMLLSARVAAHVDAFLADGSFRRSPVPSL